LSSSLTVSETGQLVRFSLVLATIERTNELSNFLLHLERQTYRNFELIIVDQNSDNRLLPVIEPYSSRLKVMHLRSPKGISRARNIGLTRCTGDVVTFPDDDCWYETRLLEKVASLLIDHPRWDGLTGKCNAPRSFHFLDRDEGVLSKMNVWRRSTSVTIFLKNSVIKTVGAFDERLGVGSESGRASAEDIDYLLRAIENRFHIYYRPDLLIDHPDASPIFDHKAHEKGVAYGRGMGYTIRKHKYPLWFLGYVLFRATGGVLLSLSQSNLSKAKYHCAAFRGRLSGWLEQN